MHSVNLLPLACKVCILRPDHTQNGSDNLTSLIPLLYVYEREESLSNDTLSDDSLLVVAVTVGFL